MLAFDWLAEASRDPDAGVRAAAALALGCARQPAQVPRLCELTADPDAGVARAAVLGLGEHGSAAARLQLVRLLHTGDGTLRPAAALALSCWAAGGDRAERELATALLQAPAADLRTAVFAGARLGARALLADAALLALDDRVPAAAAIAASRGPEPLVAALRLPERAADFPLRLAVVAALATLPGGDVGAFLAANVASGDAARTAELLLAAAPHAGVRGPLLAALLDGPKPLRAAAGLALALHGRHHADPSIRSRVWAGCRSEHSRAARPTWLLALALAGDPITAPFAIEVLQDPGAAADERLAAVDALALAADPRAIEHLQRLLRADVDPAVHAQVADVLGRRGDRASVQALAGALAASRDDAEIAPLLIALGRTRCRDAAQVLDDFARAEHRPPAVRAAALHGLARWLRPDDAALAPLPRGSAHLWLPPWLLALLRFSC